MVSEKRREFYATTPGGKSETNTWLTPKWIIDAIGPFDLDPCAFLKDGLPLVDIASKYYTETDDGLSKDWEGMVFVNFPYNQSKAWLSKCAEEYAKGNCEIIALTFVRSDTDAWQKFGSQCTGIRLINKRVRFLTPLGDVKTDGGAPSALLAFGETAFSRLSAIDGFSLRTYNDG